MDVDSVCCRRIDPLAFHRPNQAIHFFYCRRLTLAVCELLDGISRMRRARIEAGRQVASPRCLN